MIPDARDGSTLEGPVPPLPAGEPRSRGARGALPPGTALAGLAVVAAVGAAVLLFGRGRLAGRGRRLPSLPGRERLAALASRAPGSRHVRREAKVRGFWAGVLASAGSAIASTLARHLAEDVIESARRQRAAEDAARG